MAARTKQQYTVFTNNSQLILGTQNNAYSDSQNLSSSTNFASNNPGMLSPIKMTKSIQQMRSHSQNVALDNIPEINPPLQKVKRSRINDNGINLFSEAKQQQQQLVESNNGIQTNQSVILQKEHIPSHKKSMSDMLSDWLVNSNNNLTYNDIIQKANIGSNYVPSPVVGVSQTPFTTSSLATNSSTTQQQQQLQIQQTPVKKVRKSDNIYSSPTKSIQNSEYSLKNGKNIYDMIEKQVISSSQTTKNQPSGNNFIKEQIDQQASIKARVNVNKFQQQTQQQISTEQPNQVVNGNDTQSTQNTKTLENISPQLPSFNGSQVYSVRNSAQKWFNNQQQGGNQVITTSSSNKLTSSIMTQSQPNGLTQKQQINQTNILNSILSHNQQKKLPEISNSNVPGKQGGSGDNPPDVVNYLRINQSGLQIPVVKQNQNSQATYQSSIGTKPNISLRRDKIRYTSLIPIEISSQQHQTDNIRDFLGIEKPIEEKQTIIKISNPPPVQQQNGGSSSVGRFKIRKTSQGQQGQEETLNKQNGYYSPFPQQILNKNDNNQQMNMLDDIQQSTSLSVLPNSPLISPQIKSRKNSPVPQSMPSLQLNSQDFDQYSSNSENNTNSINQNNNNNVNNNANGEQIKKGFQKRIKVKSEIEINLNKLEVIKLQQAWNGDQDANKADDNKQSNQKQQQNQNLMEQLIKSQPSSSTQIYNGDTFSHFQFIRGAVLKSKGILKSKSPDQFNPSDNKQNEQQQPDQNDNRKNFHIQNVQENNLAASIQQNNKIRGQRKHNSMSNIETGNYNIYRKKCVNFKETLRVINLYRGTESIERLKKPLTGSVIS